MMKFLVKNVRLIAGIIIGIVVMILLINGCGKESKESVEVGDSTVYWKQQYAIVKSDNVAYDNANQLLTNALLDKQLEIDSIYLLKEESDRKLNDAINSNVRIAGKVVIAKENKDTASYKESCDSLTRYAGYIKSLYDATTKENSALKNEVNLLSRIKDSLISSRKKQTEELKQTVDLANTIIPKQSRRTELYVGGSVIGNKTTIFSGYAANVSMVNKSGQIYDGSVMWVNGQQFFQVGAKWRLSFRKH